MFYVIHPKTNEILAAETVRPPEGWYGENIVIYSEENHSMEEKVDPEAICTRRISVFPRVIAANSIDASIVEISDYGKSVDIDIAGTVHTIELVDNYASFELTSNTPGSDIQIKGASGKLAELSATVYAR